MYSQFFYSISFNTEQEVLFSGMIIEFILHRQISCFSLQIIFLFIRLHTFLRASNISLPWLYFSFYKKIWMFHLTWTLWMISDLGLFRCSTGIKLVPYCKIFSFWICENVECVPGTFPLGKISLKCVAVPLFGLQK